MRIKFIPAQILVGAYDIEKEMVNLKALCHHSHSRLTKAQQGPSPDDFQDELGLWT